MTPEMSVTQMLDSFVLIAKGSRVIDRKMANWGELYWLPEKEVDHMVFSVANLRIYFGHRRTNRADPFKEWLTHPLRRSVPTLGEAMKFADAAARGQIAPYIDVEAIVRNGKLRALNSLPIPPWTKP
jgi:hypothetical protein